MREYSNNEIVKGIARRKGSIIQYVYQTCYPEVRKLILMNGGNEFDAEDTFQDGLIAVYQKITGEGIELRCRFRTYLYSVCRFLWLDELKKKAYARKQSPGLASIDDRSANNKILEVAQQRLYERHFRELSKECRKVLNMYFRNASMEEICVVMGYKNVQIARDKKYRCKKTLMNKIYNNPEFKRLQDEIHLAG
jgi:RNA polymerase sigma factor (sigma-70 family)